MPSSRVIENKACAGQYFTDERPPSAMFKTSRTVKNSGIARLIPKAAKAISETRCGEIRQ